MYRHVYAQKDFHNTFQDGQSISEYCGRLKSLSDTMRDLGFAIPDSALVVQMLTGLNREMSSAISNISTKPEEWTFARLRTYLLRQEKRLTHVAHRERTTALLHERAPAPPGNGHATPPGQGQPPNGNNGGGGRTRRGRGRGKQQQQDGRARPSGNNGGAPPAIPPAWPPTHNPWTGVVQAWSMPGWRAPSFGLLGSRPGAAPPQAYHAYAPPPASLPHAGSYAVPPYAGIYNAPPAPYGAPMQSYGVLAYDPTLLAALQGVPHPSAHRDGGDWFLDTGATAHMSSDPGFSHQGTSAPQVTAPVICTRSDDHRLHPRPLLCRPPRAQLSGTHA